MIDCNKARWKSEIKITNAVVKHHSRSMYGSACSYVWFPVIYNSFTKDVAGEESLQSGFSC